MPNVWFMHRRAIRPAILPFRFKQSAQPPRKKYVSVIKLIKLFAAILVPLMIGAFTVVTTLQDSNSARYQREADLTRMERQGQLQEEVEKRQRLADLEKLHEQQDYNDRAAKEARMQNVYDAYMRDLTNIVLKPNANLTVPELLFVRSRASSILDQIDIKRKWYLIKFLYDSELLYAKDSGYRFVDLGGSDLSNNGGAEEGQCYANTHENLTGGIIPLGWQRDGDAFQVLYNGSDWKIDKMNKEWESCLFYATAPRRHRKVVLLQVIDVTELVMLIDTRRARFQVSGYLGGFDDERTQTTMTVIFRKRENRNETLIVGKVSNIDRRNKTTLLFRDQTNVIPTGTTSIIFQLIFDRVQSADTIVQTINRFSISDKQVYVGHFEKKNKHLAEIKRKKYLQRQEYMNKYQVVNLCIKNLDDNLDDKQLKKEFSKFETIISAKLSP
ncbi:unnamed protein product [Rotaria sp. Silwood2]|nr:unnamed protein product [Rotaria sp. Silwood2]CAF3954787.1 unnamed protein product [Rotaria sp. Silwood2]